MNKQSSWAVPLACVLAAAALAISMSACGGSTFVPQQTTGAGAPDGITGAGTTIEPAPDLTGGQAPEPVSGERTAGARFTCQPSAAEDVPPFVPSIDRADGTTIELPPDDPEQPAPCAPGEVPVPEPLYGPKGPPVSLAQSVGAAPDVAVDPASMVLKGGHRPRGLLSLNLQFSPYYYAAMGYAGAVNGAGYITRVEHPAVNDYGHSLNELVVFRGSLTGAFNAVEIGWRVAPLHYGDDAAHLFVFHWSGGEPQCYDACGWVQSSGTVYPGLPLPAGSEKALRWLAYGGNWWAIVGMQYIGYFPASLWRSFASGEEAQWYGEVAETALPWNEMGSGWLPATGEAGWMRAPCVIDPEAPSSCVVTVPPPPYVAYYPYSMDVPPVATPDVYHYGGPNSP